MERAVTNRVLYYSVGETKQEMIVRASLWKKEAYFLHYKLRFCQMTIASDISIQILNIVSSQSLTEKDKSILKQRLEKLIMAMTCRFTKTKMWGAIENVLLFSIIEPSDTQKLRYEINGKKIEVSILLYFPEGLMRYSPADPWPFHEYFLTYFTILVEAENNNKLCQFLKFWLRKNATYVEPLLS